MVKLIKFGIIGGSGSLILLAILYGLTELGLYYLISYVIGFICAVVSNYFWNTLWTFKTKLSFSGFIKYLFLSSITISINTLIVWFLTDKVGLYYILSATIGILTAFLINYGACRRFIWVEQSA